MLALMSLLGEQHSKQANNDLGTAEMPTHDSDAHRTQHAELDQHYAHEPDSSQHGKRSGKIGPALCFCHLETVSYGTYRDNCAEFVLACIRYRGL